MTSEDHPNQQNANLETIMNGTTFTNPLFENITHFLSQNEEPTFFANYEDATNKTNEDVIDAFFELNTENSSENQRNTNPKMSEVGFNEFENAKKTNNGTDILEYDDGSEEIVDELEHSMNHTDATIEMQQSKFDNTNEEKQNEMIKKIESTDLNIEKNIDLQFGSYFRKRLLKETLKERITGVIDKVCSFPRYKIKEAIHRTIVKKEGTYDVFMYNPNDMKQQIGYFKNRFNSLYTGKKDLFLEEQYKHNIHQISLERPKKIVKHKLNNCVFISLIVYNSRTLAFDKNGNIMIFDNLTKLIDDALKHKNVDFFINCMNKQDISFELLIICQRYNLYHIVYKLFPPLLDESVLKLNFEKSLKKKSTSVNLNYLIAVSRRHNELLLGKFKSKNHK
ncbi:hypothetical protein COBT_000309 [Conglomerata obtusa]